MKQLALTIVQFDRLQVTAALLRQKLQHEPTGAMLSAGTVGFFKADLQIGEVNVQTGQGWIQKAGGGSESVTV